jgi:hypothetical protein
MRSLSALLVISMTACLADLSAEARSAEPEARQARQGGPPAGGTPQTPSAPPAPAPPPGQNVVSPPPLGRVFASEQGLIFNAIRPDKVMDFETVLAKLRAALADSKDPVRNQQGWGWKIYKAAEPGPNGSVLYVFVMDPAVKGADYGVAKILSEAYPNEIMDLYRMYTGAFATAGQTLINLQPIPALNANPASSAPASDGAPAGSAPSSSATPKR